MGDTVRPRQPYEKRDRERDPLSLERDARPLAGVAAIAVRVAIAHAAPAGGFRPLPAGRVARSAGLAEPAALFLHLMTRGITGCARDGRAASPGPAYAVRVRGPGSSFAGTRAPPCRAAAPPPRR